MTTEIQIDPLERPALAGPIPEAPVAPAAPAPVVKKTWRQKRWERRRRRIWLEELLGWILVPIILIGAYWAIDAALNALGTSPSAIINGIGAIMQAL
jgi:hypothetical protein